MTEPSGDRKRPYPEPAAPAATQISSGPATAAVATMSTTPAALTTMSKRIRVEVADPMAHLKPAAVPAPMTRPAAGPASAALAGLKSPPPAAPATSTLAPATNAMAVASAGGATAALASSISPSVPHTQIKLAPNPIAAAAPATKTTMTTTYAQKLPIPPKTTVPPPKQPSHSQPIAPPPRSESPPPPLKSLTFHHLHKKYSPELDYMLIEFRKLERQLLGAPAIQQLNNNKSNNLNNGKPAAAASDPPKKVESAGSKERREKLQGFISHLEDTIRQISEGCLIEKQEQLMERSQGATNDIGQSADSSEAFKHEEEKKSSDSSIIKDPLTTTTTATSTSSSSSSTAPSTNTTAPPRKFTADFTAAEASLSHLPPEKEKEESVQRLEEHILANLLPVKVRLTRQLAAQKGATKNPVTAPLSARHGHLRNTGVGGVGGGKVVGTIKEEAEAKRKALLLQQEKEQHSASLSAGSAAVGSGQASSDIASTAAAVSTAPAPYVTGPAAAPSQYGRPLGQTGSSLTARLHGKVLGTTKKAESSAAATSASAGAAAAASAKGPPSTAPATNAAASAALNSVVSPSKRRILYAGIAPGSNQVPSSINAVSGVHPGLIGEDAAKAVALAEEERKRLKQLEESAARVALGETLPGAPTPGALPPALDPQNQKPAAIPTPVHATTPTTVPSSLIAPAPSKPLPTPATAALKSPPEGPATLAARARAQQAATALAAARASSSIQSKSRPNQPIPPMAKPPGYVTRVAAPTAAQVPQQHLQQKAPPVTHSRAPPPQAIHHLHTHPTSLDSAQAPTANTIVQQPVKKNNPRKPYTPPDFHDPSLTPTQQFELRLSEARRRQRKRRRARRRQRKEGELNHLAVLQQQSPHAQSLQQQQRILSAATAAHASSMGVARSGGKGGSPGGTAPAAVMQVKKNGVFGPRTVEYVCALCNEGYASSCDMNPWWALSSHDCPKCGKIQIPRLDISSPANAIEYHPALLSHLDENNTSSASENAVANNTSPSKTQQSMQGSYIARQTPIFRHSSTSSNTIRKSPTFSDSEVSGTDESDGEGGSGDYNYESSDDEQPIGEDDDVDSVTREERIEREDFGFDYKGEKLTDAQAKKLLVLIEHASTCPGRHHCEKHRNVCHSTKYLMLHARDCTGLLSNGDICPFPWCRKVKHLLYHLVSCQKNGDGVCSICCTQDLSPSFTTLVGLNTHRRKRYVERSKAYAAAAAKRQLAASNAAKMTAAQRRSAAPPAVRQPHQQYQKKHPPRTAVTQYRAPIAHPKVPHAAPPPATPTYTSVPIPSTLAAPNPPHTTAPAPAYTIQPATPIHHTTYAANPLSPTLESWNVAQSPANSNNPAALEPLPSPSPAFSNIPASMSAVSVFNLEEPVVDIGDIVLSSSDLMSDPLEHADVTTLCDDNQTTSSASELKISASNGGSATQAFSSTGTTL